MMLIWWIKLVHPHFRWHKDRANINCSVCELTLHVQLQHNGDVKE